MFVDFAPTLKAAAIAVSRKKTTVSMPASSNGRTRIVCRCCGKSSNESGRIFHADRCLFRQV